MTSFRTGLNSLCKTAALAAFAMLVGPSLAHAQQMSVVNTPHNLSASGPGTIRALTEDQPCIFCHTPHHASDIRPLWSHTMSTSVYTPYRSTSLQASPDQPTGTSKLCLSCHDGTVALGSVVSRTQTIELANNVTKMPPGRTNLGTDLSDDHPISFKYDQTLIQRNPKLKNPTGLPTAIKLDANSELQCVSCHDPHDNQYGNFLVMDNGASQLCTSCHNQGTTTVATHNNCSSCHQPHTAPSGPYLLKSATVTQTCVASTCHGTSAPRPDLNIASDLGKFAKHDTNSAVNLPNHGVPDNVVCSDCHEGHTMGSTGASGAPVISPRMGKIDGINAQGTKVAIAQYEYEVCFKCHGDNPTTKVTLRPRQIVQPNLRLTFASSAISFHPVERPGKSTDVPSLLTPLSATSVIYCTSCHASNSSPAGGGAGASGPHGSNNPGVLVANYTTTDGTSESPGAYALCYSCHDRNSILSNVSFKEHNRHIAKAKAPCSVCHDSHGVASGTSTGNAHLINFDTSVVTAVPGQPIKYESRGIRSGACTLLCHNHRHNPSTY